MTIENGYAGQGAEIMTKERELAFERWRDYFKKNEKMLEGTSILTPTMINKILDDHEGRFTSDFRYNVRERVKRGLVHLQFLIELASSNVDLDMVLNVETLRPLAMTLFWRPVLDVEKPDLAREEIAQLFIRLGFDFLTRRAPITLSAYNDAIRQANEFTNIVVKLLRAEGNDSGGSDG